MRRAFMALIVMSLLCTCLLSADWPQFMGPSRDNISPETGLLKTWDGKPAEVWGLDVGTGFGPAAIEAGKVYVLDRVGDKSENKMDVLRCIDLKTGKEDWKFEYAAPGEVPYPGSRSTPTVDKDYIFIAGPMGDFKCIDKKEHKEVWSKNIRSDFGGKTPAQKDPQWALSQSPLLYKDTVIAAPQSKQAGVVAFDKKSGEVKWKSEPIGSIAYCSPVLVKIGDVDQVVMMTFTAESKDTKYAGVYGLNAADGKLLWSYKGYTCSIPVPSPHPVGDGRLFLTGGYGAGSAMIKVELKDGKYEATEQWRVKEVGSHVQNPVLYKDHLYINSDNTNMGLVCLGLDGKVKWATKQAANFDKGNLILADGLIYIMNGSNGTLHLVEASSEAYKELDKAKVLEGKGKEVWAPMSLSDGKLIVRDKTRMKCIQVGKAE